MIRTIHSLGYAVAFVLAAGGLVLAAAQVGWLPFLAPGAADAWLPTARIAAYVASAIFLAAAAYGFLRIARSNVSETTTPLRRDTFMTMSVAMSFVAASSALTLPTLL